MDGGFLEPLPRLAGTLLRLRLRRRGPRALRGRCRALPGALLRGDSSLPLGLRRGRRTAHPRPALRHAGRRERHPRGPGPRTPRRPRRLQGGGGRCVLLCRGRLGEPRSRRARRRLRFWARRVSWSRTPAPRPSRGSAADITRGEARPASRGGAWASASMSAPPSTPRGSRTSSCPGSSSEASRAGAFRRGSRPRSAPREGGASDFSSTTERPASRRSCPAPARSSLSGRRLSGAADIEPLGVLVIEEDEPAKE